MFTVEVSLIHIAWMLLIINPESEFSLPSTSFLPSARSAAGAHLKLKDFSKSGGDWPAEIGASRDLFVYRKRFNPPILFALPPVVLRTHSHAAVLFLLLLFVIFIFG
jgi:hypothetical protein